jgi:hypothetical protein
MPPSKVWHVQRASTHEVPGRGVLRKVGSEQGKRFEAPFQDINYEPNRRYAHRGTAEHPVPVTMVFTHEPLSSDETRFTPRIEADPGRFFGLARPLLERAIRRPAANQPGDA